METDERIAASKCRAQSRQGRPGCRSQLAEIERRLGSRERVRALQGGDEARNTVRVNKTATSDHGRFVRLGTQLREEIGRIALARAHFRLDAPDGAFSSMQPVPGRSFDLEKVQARLRPGRDDDLLAGHEANDSLSQLLDGTDVAVIEMG